MRKFDRAINLLAAVMIVGAGCRQTTGPATPGALGPMGPLAPVAPGQAPALGPFGGPTRVTPPPTGSVNQSSYQAPVPAAGGPYFGSSLSPARSGQGAIGSGVQAASFTETNSNFAEPAADNLAASRPPAVRDPRRGGMQVIDLTGAPDPPGYRPPLYPQTGPVPFAPAPAYRPN